MAKRRHVPVAQIQPLQCASFATTVEESPEELVQSGLIFYESDDVGHKDSKGRTWIVTADDIQEIVENTNEFLEESDISIFKEHQKDIDSAVGIIDEPLEARIINEYDVAQKPKLKNLIGRYGIFCNAAKIKDPAVIQKLKNGIGKTVSCGVDFAQNVIRELSLVGIGALSQATLFSRRKEQLAHFMSALTLSDALAESAELDGMREEGHKLLDTLYDVVDNITNLSDQELQGQSREIYYQQVLNEFQETLPEYLPLQRDADYEQEMQQQMQTPINQPPSPMAYQGRFSQNDQVLAAFTMDEIEDLYYADFYEFPWQRRKKSSVVGNAAKVAAGVGLGAAAIGLGGRYGIGKAIAKSAGLAKTGFQGARKSGTGVLGSLGAGANAVKGGGFQANRTLRKDLVRGKQLLRGKKSTPSGRGRKIRANPAAPAALAPATPTAMGNKGWNVNMGQSPVAPPAPTAMGNRGWNMTMGKPPAAPTPARAPSKPIAVATPAPAPMQMGSRGWNTTMGTPPAPAPAPKKKRGRPKKNKNLE
jgi:hypothetical protein